MRYFYVYVLFLYAISSTHTMQSEIVPLSFDSFFPKTSSQKLIESIARIRYIVKRSYSQHDCTQIYSELDNALIHALYIGKTTVNHHRNDDVIRAVKLCEYDLKNSYVSAEHKRMMFQVLKKIVAHVNMKCCKAAH